MCDCLCVFVYACVFVSVYLCLSFASLHACVSACVDGWSDKNDLTASSVTCHLQRNCHSIPQHLLDYRIMPQNGHVTLGWSKRLCQTLKDKNNSDIMTFAVQSPVALNALVRLTSKSENYYTFVTWGTFYKQTANVVIDRSNKTYLVLLLCLPVY